MRGRIFAIIMAAILMFAVSAAVAAPAELGITVDGKAIVLSASAYSTDGRVMVPVKEVFEHLGASVNIYFGGQMIVVVKGETKILMSIDSTSALINGYNENILMRPVKSGDTIFVPVRFIAESFGVYVDWDGSRQLVVLDTTRSYEEILASRGDSSEKYPIVVIDAGHGGKDPGAISGSAVEKTLNLDIAKRLKDALEEKGVKTVMTRTKDVFVGLYDRSDLANKSNAGVLVSIHNNASGNSKTNGTMTLYYPSSGKASGDLEAKEFASIVQNQLVSDLGTKNLGIISRPNLAVLRTARMPAVIAEVGYLTNEAERNKLLQSSYRQKAADSLAKAVIKALNKI